MAESGGGSNQLEQQIQAFMERSNRKLQHMEEWYHNRFRTFHSSENQYNLQRSECEQRVSTDPCAYHQYPGANPSFYRDSSGDFTGGFANPTWNYLDSPTSVYSYQIPWAYQIDNTNPGFYFVQFGDGSVVSMTGTKLENLLNSSYGIPDSNVLKPSDEDEDTPSENVVELKDENKISDIPYSDASFEVEDERDGNPEIEEDQVFNKSPLKDDTKLEPNEEKVFDKTPLKEEAGALDDKQSLVAGTSPTHPILFSLKMVPDCIALNFERVAYPDIAVKVVADD
ncbi:hypothetical protein A4A49_39666 [Nicotiana attenuata]|uniref:Uncharacterized protein n=1 Tax=Nicotiana attenuata TaxID=49451 RepID=A0A314KPX1_NICAT|nr:hypothetical protein A4A49_39666 [Nicotiana attenuata]